MKKLDFEKSIESFSLFDVFMLGVAIFGLSLGLIAWFIGGWWIVGSFLMILCEGILVYAIWFAPRMWRITSIRESLVRNPSVWIKIVFASDLHAGSQTTDEHFIKFAQAVNDLRPDLVLYGGDFVTGHANEVKNLAALVNIKTPYGTYFVLGNHDYADDPDPVRRMMIANKGIDLTNVSLTLRIHGKELCVTGLDDTLLGKPMVMPDRLADGVPHITLAHSPDSLFDIHEGQTDLLLCGHTHGGQIRFPFFGCLGVPTKLGCRADQGIKIVNGIRAYVSRGVGVVGCRARWLCRPEIVLLELGI